VQRSVAFEGVKEDEDFTHIHIVRKRRRRRRRPLRLLKRMMLGY
jgi:hypothetical protein